MKNIKRTLCLFLFMGSLCFIGKTNVFAMGGEEVDLSKSATALTLLRKQTHEAVTDLQIEKLYQYFMMESSWAPGKIFPYSNSGGFQNTISDGVYTYNAGGAAGCMLYAQFVSGVVYGRHRNIKTDCTDMTENGVKEFLKRNAQFGEHVRVDNLHSVVFLSLDDRGFYGMEYWDDTYIHFVYYSFSNFIRQAGNRSVWVYDIDTAINQTTEMPVVDAPEYTLTALDDTPVSTNGSGYKATILIFGSTTCGNTKYTLSSVAESDWVKSPDIRVIFAEIQQASKEDVQNMVKLYGSEDIISCYDTTTKTSSAMWFYIMRYYGSASTATMPVIVLIDENNMIRDVHQDGELSADELIVGINKFTDTGYTTSDPYYEAIVNLKVSGTEDYISAKQVFELTNQARNQNGLASLHLDKDLTEAAMQRAAEIAIYYSHSRPDGSTLKTGILENIGAGYLDSEGAMNGWLNSPGHYASIMNENMTNMGVGCFVDNRGSRYWVQCFASNSEYTEPEIYNRDVTNRMIPTKASFVSLKTDSKRIFSCNDTTAEIQMRIWTVNNWVSPFLDADLFNFESDNSAIATVGIDGKVTLHGTGTAAITATLKGEVPLSVRWVIEKKNHLYGTEVISPTYTRQGYTKHTCSSCGDSYADNYTPILSKPESSADNRPGGGTSNPANGGQTVQTGKCKVKSIKISASKKILKAEETIQLRAVIKTTGRGKANTKLKWKSSKKKYAAVSQKGKVRTKKAGKGKLVTITAMATDGTGIKAKIKLKIK